jgi:hypothetical protein
MDTHISTDPFIETAITGITARLPGEADGPQPQPGESGAPDTLPAAAPKLTRRHHTLMTGAAVAAVAVASAGAFVLSPYNHLFPVPFLQSSVNSAGNSPESRRHPILAPSASLANVSVPPVPPVTNETYTPKPRQQAINELLSLHPRATAQANAEQVAPAKAVGQPGKAASANPSGGATALAESGTPSSDVPHEPGSLPVLPSPSHKLSTQAASPIPVPSVAPAKPAPKDATAMIIASLSPAQPEASVDVKRIGAGPTVAPTAPPPAEPAPVAAAALPPADSHSADNPAQNSLTPTTPTLPTPDAIAVASNLRAAPMTAPEQVQVLNLVTEMAAMVKDLRKQLSQLRADLGKSAADVTARLIDYERRLALTEALSAMATAEARSQPAGDPAGVELKPVFLPAPRAVAIVPVPVPAAAASKPPAASPKLYRVQAASPGLALLAQVDRGGGVGAQLQVSVGDTVPEYGRIKSIAQKGTAWVVTTEHGAIQ